MTIWYYVKSDLIISESSFLPTEYVVRREGYVLARVCPQKLAIRQFDWLRNYVVLEFSTKTMKSGLRETINNELLNEDKFCEELKLW